MSLVFGVLWVSAANAHSALDGLAGFGHPFSGLDHVLAMVATGLFAASLGGRALWIVPAAFVTMMAAGGAMGASGVELHVVEAGISASVIALGIVLALRMSLPTAVAMGLVGVVAIFHGHSHVVEAPAAASSIAYAGGFMVATAVLHASGVALGLGLARINPRILQLGGGATAIAGAGILTGIL